MKRLPSSSSPMSAPLLLLCVATYSLWSAPATIKVDVSRPGHALSPMLYGIFFEDINCSADGGLYAEMVRNRNLEDSDKPDYGTTESSGAAVVAITLDSSNPASSKNPHSLRVQIANPGGRRAGVVNEGFWECRSLKATSTN